MGFLQIHITFFISKWQKEKKYFTITALCIFFFRVQKKEYKKRATTTIPFMLADGVELGVSV